MPERTDPVPGHTRLLASKSARSLLLVLIAVFAVQLITIRDNVPLGSDASLYLLHARNIVEGRPYAETGYVVNPSRPDHSPVTYPPGLPLLLAPVYAFAELDLGPYKVEMVLLLVMACAAVFAVARPRVGHWPALIVVASLGFLPYTFRFKNDILSDIPFLVFLYLSLWYAERQLVAELSPAQRLRRGLVTGVLVFVASATRSLGVFVIPALVLAEWLRRRRWPLLGITAGVVSASFLLALEAVMADTTYLDMPAATVERIRFQVVAYTQILRDMWHNPVPASLRWVTFGLLTATALVGWLSRLRRPGVMEFFLAIYLGVIGLAPVFAGHRYLLPVLPLQAIFAITGVTVLARASGRWKPAVATGLIVLLGLPLLYSYGQGFRFRQKGPLGTGYDAPAVVEVTEYLKANTTADEVILSHMPRTIALLTGRRSVIHNRASPDAEHWALIEEHGIRTVVFEPAKGAPQRILIPLISRYPERFERTFRNAQFEVWTIKPAREPS